MRRARATIKTHEDHQPRALRSESDILDKSASLDSGERNLGLSHLIIFRHRWPVDLNNNQRLISKHEADCCRSNI